MSKGSTFTAYRGEFFLESEIGRVAAEKAYYHILPFPFEASVSYEGGAGEGPAAIIRASQQLELYDAISYPGESGIFTHAPMELDSAGTPGGSQIAVSDEAVAALFQKAQNKTSAILESGHMPVILGGEHSISYGPIMAAAEHAALQQSSMGIVQIDAHADMRLAYEGRVWSHASVMRRCADAGIPIFQIGTRALCREELEYREARPHLYHIDARELFPRSNPLR